MNRLIVVAPSIQGSFKRWNPLLDRLAAEPALEGARWMKWEKKYGKFSFTSPTQLALDLQAAINAEWIAHGPFDDIILTGHSMGGLLVRAAYLIGCGVDSIPRPRAEWVDRVSRIVLFAATNRGLNPKSRMDVRIAAFASKYVPPLQRSLVWQILRGSAFITNLRIGWLRYFASAPASRPVVVQLLGAEDSLVKREDSIDVEQFDNAYLIDVPGANHEDLYELQATDDPESRYLLLRDAFVNARPEKGKNRTFEGPKKVVMIMHGIRANNKTWVSSIKADIKQRWPDVEPIGPEHEYLSALAFAWPITRRRHLPWFQDAYADALARNPQAEFNFIGHSNGTYLLGQSLKAIPGMRFERAVLAASVLPRDFDWKTCMTRKQVQSLRVDGSHDDGPVGLLCSALSALGMRDIGTGGFLGFTQNVPQEQFFWHRGGHSGPLHKDNLPGLAEYAVTGAVVRPSQMAPELKWFSVLSRMMRWIGRGILIVPLACVALTFLTGSPWWAGGALLVILLVLVFLKFY
jgi:pimeloyl-ACP methyl ester carboxylesterase